MAPAVDVYIYSGPGSPLGCAEVGDMAGRFVEYILRVASIIYFIIVCILLVWILYSRVIVL